MALVQIVRSLFARRDPILIPLLGEIPCLPQDSMSASLLQAKRLRDMPEADVQALAQRLGIGSFTVPELEDEALLDGVALLLGRQVGRLIGAASLRHYRDPAAALDFLRGPVRDACSTIPSGRNSTALAAYIEGITCESALMHVEVHMPTTYLVPARRSAQILHYGQLQDGVDLLRNARQAVELHRGPIDEVTLAYQAQMRLFTDSVEQLRLSQAVEIALEQIPYSGDSEVIIASARTIAKARWPFSSEQRKLLARAMGAGTTPGGMHSTAGLPSSDAGCDWLTPQLHA